MPLSQPQWRAIEIMQEQMERLELNLTHNRSLPKEKQRSTVDVIASFYDEQTRMGQFELNYLNAIGKCLAPDATYADGIVTTRI